MFGHLNCGGGLFKFVNLKLDISIIRGVSIFCSCFVYVLTLLGCAFFATLFHLLARSQLTARADAGVRRTEQQPCSGERF